MADKILGNVAAVVRSISPPLESDGVTVKTYVIWAVPIGAHINGISVNNTYDMRVYDTSTAVWVSLINSANAITFGKFQIFKKPGNANSGIIEVGDIVQGFIGATTFFKGQYVAGNTGSIASYNVLEEYEL